jgi:aldose 1-epimerase
MDRYPSGEQWVISHGDQEATVVEVGGGLRTYRAGTREVLAGYGQTEQCAYGRGQALIPWPNRVRDGKYTFAGKGEQLALTEPARGNASHGLVRWALWSLLEHEASKLTVGYRLHPQQGWRGHLDLTVSYALDDLGLSVSTSAVNAGSRPVPFGYGAHPYIAIGDAPLADVELGVPGGRRVLVDDRSLPTGTELVEGSDFDFRSPRPLGGTELDTAFTDLDRGGDGRWRVTVRATPDRPGVALWAGRAFDWVQVFTAQGKDAGVAGQRGIAVEPMTCPADAFNSGDGLVVLEPGQSWSGEWGLSLDR